MAYPTYAVAKYFVAMALKRHPWTHTKMLQLAINSKCQKSVAHSHYSSLLAGISLEKSSASHSATATLTIKPERLAHLCVEQALLYPWMCFTSWFELHRSQDERFSAPSSVNFTQGHWPFCCVRQGRVHYDSCCTLNLLIKQTIHYTDKNYTNFFIILQSVNLKDIHCSMYAR